MRGGICSIQLQALTQEAATVVKQAVNLATRRGHAQVTPLHVASAMLATSTGLLRKACLQCHSHPLQCKALELCFNVALNRLPASTHSPLLGPQYSTTPSLSNALVAAFKRAQAHQRRGTIENQQQQQHILALKIEVEQLIISILDDPSVSRVMREAGFNSTLVKSRVEVEQSLPIEVSSTKTSSEYHRNNQSKEISINMTQSRPYGQVGNSYTKPIDSLNNDDVTSVLNELVKRRRNTVIVGESVSNAEGVAKGVMERFEIGNVPNELRYVQIVSLPLICFRNISKEEVEKKIMEVRSLVKSYMGRGVILYLGDLKWLFEFWSSYCEQKINYYCSVEHMVMEVKKLVSGSGESSSRLWLMGIANFKTYMKCKISYPSLETIWELHPFTIPVGSLSLSLTFDSDFQAKERSMVLFKDLAFEDKVGVRKYLTCCKDCSIKFENEALSMSSNISKKACSSSLPTWLQNCKEERSYIIEDQESAKLKELCRKWNSICKSVHRQPSIHDKQDLFVLSSSPSSPTSFSSLEKKSSFQHSHLNWPIISEPEKVAKECELLYTENGGDDDDCYDGNLIMFMPQRNIPKPDLLSNPNSSPNSASSSEAVDGLESTEMFNEHNEENLKILCDALENKFPSQHKEIISEIASTVLFCRSGMRKRGNNLIKRENQKQETWMFFLGDDDDSQAKENISKELAKVIFGSYSNFMTVGISTFSSLGNDDSSSDEKSKKKRPRAELGSTYLQKFGEAVNENPHRVFFMEDLDQVDHFTQKGIKKAIESGSLAIPDGESVPLKDAIIIFSCESFSSVSKSQTSCGENKGKETMIEEDHKSSLNLSLDLNIAIEDHDNTETGILELVDKKISFNM